MLTKIAAIFTLVFIVLATPVSAEWTPREIKQANSDYEGVVYLTQRALHDPRLRTKDAEQFTVAERQNLVEVTVRRSTDQEILRELRKIRKALHDIARELDGLAQ